MDAPSNEDAPASWLPAYDGIQYRIKIGDVFAFCGHTHIADMIKLATRGHVTHVTLIYDVADQPDAERSIMLMESTARHLVEDEGELKIQEGVQMHSLPKWLHARQGKVWWVPLKEPLEPKQEEALQACARDIYREHTAFSWSGMYGLGFEKMTGLKLFTHHDFHSLFCSQFVASALVGAGLVPDTIDPSLQSPRDVIEYPIFAEPILIKEA